MCGVRLKRFARLKSPGAGRPRNSRRGAGATVRLLSFFEWVGFFAPLADAAIHGDDVGVAHFLEVVGGQRATLGNPHLVQQTITKMLSRLWRA